MYAWFGWTGGVGEGECGVVVYESGGWGGGGVFWGVCGGGFCAGGGGGEEEGCCSCWGCGEYCRGAGGEDDVPLPHSLEVLVRKWGMPTRLEKGRVVLDQEFVVCEEGKTLNSNQTALLKLFGVAMAEFKVQILAWWSAAEQEVTVHEQAGDIGDASDHEDAERMEEG